MHYVDTTKCGRALPGRYRAGREGKCAKAGSKTPSGLLEEIGALARRLGISQPSVSNWQRVPAERVIAVEALTGVPRASLRPDLYGMPDDAAAADIDEIDRLRAHEYGLLAVLLGRAPAKDLLERLSELKGDATPLGLAHIALAELACDIDPDALSREYFDLFIGVGRGELLPYASYYLTGFLQRAPAGARPGGPRRLGIERAEGHARAGGSHRHSLRGDGGPGRRTVRGRARRRAALLRAASEALGGALLRRSRDGAASRASTGRSARIGRIFMEIEARGLRDADA